MKSEKHPKNQKQMEKKMITDQKQEQSQETVKKLAFMKFERYFWSKDRQTLFLVISDGVVVPVHVNFMKARVGVKYEPKTKKQDSQAA
jgi:hypothetical protein